MKKILTAFALILICNTAFSQDHSFGRQHGQEIMRALIVISVLVLFMWFIISIINRFMEFRLKNKIIDKGIAEHVASSILQTTGKDDRNVNIKWFAVLTGLGCGLLLVYHTQPLDIHSLAYMAFSLGFSFLAYYIFLRASESKR